MNITQCITNAYKTKRIINLAVLVITAIMMIYSFFNSESQVWEIFFLIYVVWTAFISITKVPVKKPNVWYWRVKCILALRNDADIVIGSAGAGKSWHFNEKTVSTEETDLNKFAFFTMELTFMLHAKAPISETVLEALMKMRTYELKEMVINNLKDSTYSPEGPKYIEVDNSEIQNKVNDMLMNFETYVNAYMKSKYH